MKRLKLQDNCLYLMPENPEFPPLLVTENNTFSVWGVVTYVVRELG
ncbi:LexA family protein [Flavobacterium sp. RNTU_13]